MGAIMGPSPGGLSRLTYNADHIMLVLKDREEHCQMVSNN